MEPLPEVRASAESLASRTGVDVLRSLDTLAEVVVSLVPSCVGVSLTVIVDGDPFTLTCTSAPDAVLDATQYLDGGPCVDAARTGGRVGVPDVLDEERWCTYGRAAAAQGVRSSLSLPVYSVDRQLPGAINLYASDPDAFSGCAPALAAALQVPAEYMVANADLSFMTRQFARELPARLRARERVDIAVGLLMALHGWDAEETRTRLRKAARCAGTSEDKVAELLLALHDSSESR